MTLNYSPKPSGSSRNSVPTESARDRLAAVVAEMRKRATGRISAAARRCPVVFAEEVLGLRLWRRQREFLEAVRDHDRVTVTSGHKTGKSTSFAVLAWWFTCDPEGRPAARVAMSSASARQVKKILWREIRALWRRAKARGYDLGPEPALDPETGIQWDDGREVFGFTARDPEKAAGTSGAWLLFLLDEASGIPEEIFEAIEGNRAGGAKVALASNPTQQSGEFYESHHTKRRFYRALEISSEEAAEVDPPIPGLASAAWVAEKREEWGEDSPLYHVRVRGRFAAQATDAVVGLGAVLDGVERGRDEAEGVGRLCVGFDVARFGDDETILAPRRGARVYPLIPIAAGDGPDTAARAMIALADAGLIRAGEKPLVFVDANGVGASVYDALARRADCEAVAVNTATAATKPDDYINLRAELHFAFKRWLRDGGMLPDDGRLQSELVAPKYSVDGRNRIKVESKDEIRARLRRSPDRADAVMLSLAPTPVRNDEPTPPPKLAAPPRREMRAPRGAGW